MNFDVESGLGRRRDAVVGHAPVGAHVLAVHLGDVEDRAQDVAGC